MGNAWSNSAQLRSDGDARCTRCTSPSRISTHTTSSPCGASAHPNAAPVPAGGSGVHSSPLPRRRWSIDWRRIRNDSNELTEADVDAGHRVTLTVGDDPQARVGGNRHRDAHDARRSTPPIRARPARPRRTPPPARARGVRHRSADRSSTAFRGTGADRGVSSRSSASSSAHSSSRSTPWARSERRRGPRPLCRTGCRSGAPAGGSRAP